jgi:hypothetical protein
VFNYVKVEFPDSSVGPAFVYNLTLHQNRYHHEMAVMQFRDWNVEYDAVSNGSPISFTIDDGNNKKDFRGYVHKVIPDQTPSHNMTTVIAASASYVMKSPSQTVYRNLSADGLVEEICNKYRFNAFTIPHPRVYPQISQAGHTDWEIMVQVAKEAGCTLRTEGTEVYFQPVLEDYTNKRAEAPRFAMRDASHPSGSTIYSFDAGISEAEEHDGDVKAAIAVSGFDSITKTPISITQQVRSKKTKTKSKPEFFDKFATNIVAPDPAVAKYEAEAAEQRASFPYRATVVVLGHAGVRPDLPVYLDGVGDYSGYWTVLGTEHLVEEEHRNTFMYTTKLYVGTDSLGSAARWKDGKQITNPDASPARTLIPGVRQTNTPPSSRVIKTAANIGPQSKGSFNAATNRPKASVNNRTVSAPKWVAATPTPKKITQPVEKTQDFPKRLLSKVSKNI